MITITRYLHDRPKVTFPILDEEPSFYDESRNKNRCDLKYPFVLREGMRLFQNETFEQVTIGTHNTSAVNVSTTG